jgi:SNF2 family DNA or RNA helicase
MTTTAPASESALIGDFPPEYVELVRQAGAGAPASRERTELVDAAVRVWRRPGFDTIVCRDALRFEPFDYQLRAAAVVLRQMGGRALLADEVGLGKTIEAGIVLTELRQRGLAASVLVLTPAGLVGQWSEELERKFALPTIIATRSHTPAEALPGEGDDPVLIASLALARRAPLSDALAEREWDLVVVDEAHRVRNPRTASSRLVRSLRTRFLLLLTATPVENRLEDLFHLVSLVRPGHLGTLAEFRAHHAPAGPGGDDRRPPARESSGEGGSSPVAALADLRRALRAVMVRHRRSDVALMLPKRLAETRLVVPSHEEAVLYAAISNRVREQGRSAPGRELVLQHLQRLAGSTAQAVAPALERAGWADLAAGARSVRDCAKTELLGTLLDRHLAAGEKVIVFTSFRDTLAHLAAWAGSTGRRCAQYHGSLTRHEKDAAIAKFADDADVLLSTESAGEGRNLQFCHAMINFDLPWNPMQIEQRLGRVHRIGQTHEVVLTNIAAKGTLEERILSVLHTKLNIFELVVGELDMVLGRVSQDFVFEDAIFRAHLDSASDDELGARFEELGAALIDARTAYVDNRSWTDRLVATLEGEGATAP